MEQLEPQKLIVSQFWRQEAQDQGVDRAAFPLKVLEKDLFQASLLTAGGFLLCSSTSLDCTCVSLYPNSSYMD